ncbi:uncharacterized protein LOC115224572 isoform X1 [Octopus sinensis]|uniref:Uncharacterized protein LOC115224572 isoform X1 n=1 Tax=Octopus sinensis TaxID=2607531 RepID=A0A7E6FR88_9MOLL|nr:uncharacterized protein LOC115224572 isoform X1 [Octopus sinensis]
MFIIHKLWLVGLNERIRALFTSHEVLTTKIEGSAERNKMGLHKNTCKQEEYLQLKQKFKHRKISLKVRRPPRSILGNSPQITVTLITKASAVSKLSFCLQKHARNRSLKRHTLVAVTVERFDSNAGHQKQYWFLNAIAVFAL